MADLADGDPVSPMLPDLVVVWGEAPAEAITHVTSQRYGTVSRSGGGSGRDAGGVSLAIGITLILLALVAGFATPHMRARVRSS